MGKYDGIFREQFPSWDSKSISTEIDIQLEFREDFYASIDNAYDTNEIFRE